MTDQEIIKRLAEWLGLESSYDKVDKWLYVKIELSWVRWNPLERIQDAWMLVERAGDCLHLKEHGEMGTWCAMFCGLMTEWVHADTAPLAICKAIEKIMEESRQTVPTSGDVEAS